MTRDSIRGFMIIIGIAIVATVFFNVSGARRWDHTPLDRLAARSSVPSKTMAPATSESRAERLGTRRAGRRLSGMNVQPSDGAALSF